jgi:predicted deacylase
LYVARLEPYRLSDLDKLKADIRDHPLVEITTIGHTVEHRELELIRVGKPAAPHHVLLRARAHPWEPGGNWVVEGLIRRLLQDDDGARRYLDRYALYVLPMANKDGVARGRTRFNLRGMDLNRKWDQPADPELAPENAALEKWLQAAIASGKRPELAIDFHNDASGRLHVSRPEIGTSELQEYTTRMERLERLLREKTWFTEGSTTSSFRNPGTIGEGLLARYGIAACIHELNANRIAGLDDHPTATAWKKYGQQLAEVFWEYFGS